MATGDTKERIMAAARSKIETWRCDYSEVRPHSALGNRTPIEYAAQVGLAE
jgi:putative transposase